MNNVYIFCGSILIILVVMMQLHYRRRGDAGKGEPQESPSEKQAGDTVCCGKHAVCEKQRLSEALARKAVYFDDEELDRFTGRTSDSYSDDEIEEFRYVIYTMRQNEVRDWLESLIVRGIELPDQLKDEAGILMEDSAQ